jgi:hypothetical protein
MGDATRVDYGEEQAKVDRVKTHTAR